jgi:hypothetical protein
MTLLTSSRLAVLMSVRSYRRSLGRIDIVESCSTNSGRRETVPLASIVGMAL